MFIGVGHIQSVSLQSARAGLISRGIVMCGEVNRCVTSHNISNELMSENINLNSFVF